MMKSVFILILIFISVMAEQARAAIDPQADVVGFCSQNNRRMPSPGKQFDGKPADATVLGLKPGYYPLNDNGYVQVFDKGYWLMKKPRTLVTFFAASSYSGGEIHTVNQMISGCSLEFLSEIITRNHISLLSATPVKPDDLPQTRNPGQLP